MKAIPEFLVYSLLIICAGSCKNLSDMKVNTDRDQPLPIAENEQIKFSKSWNRWDKPQSGRLYDYSIKGNTLINGVPCRSRFTVDSAGMLYGFILSEDYELNGSLIPAGSRYEARVRSNGERAGYMIYLSRSTDIQGFPVRHKAFPEDYKADFYQNGTLKAFKMTQNKEIDGVPCSGGKKHDIWLYPDGKLMGCTLSANYTAENMNWQPGTRILIDQEGKIYLYSTNKHAEITNNYTLQ